MIEVNELPDCCHMKLREIERILDSFDAIEVILSIAPSLNRPPPFGITSVMAALWHLAKTGVSYSSNRQSVQSALDSIARNRIRTVIQLHLLDHNGELRRYWTRLLNSF